MQHLQKTGGGYPFSRWRSLPTSLGISPTLPFNFQLSTINLLCAAFHGSRVTDHASFSSFSPYFVTSLLHYVQKRRRPSRSDGAAAKRAHRLQERRSCRWKIQFPRGGGDASVTPLNLCMCIPWLPIVTV